MYCSKCGKELNADQAYCDGCGQKVGSNSTRPQVIYVSEKSAGVAAVLSLLFTGLGQIYVGKIMRGLAVMLLCILLGGIGAGLLYAAVFTGGLGGIIAVAVLLTIAYLVIWIWNIFDAYNLANSYNESVRRTGNRPW